MYIYTYISFHTLINQSKAEITHLHRLPYQMVTSKKIYQPHRLANQKPGPM